MMILTLHSIISISLPEIEPLLRNSRHSSPTFEVEVEEMSPAELKQKLVAAQSGLRLG